MNRTKTLSVLNCSSHNSIQVKNHLNSQKWRKSLPELCHPHLSVFTQISYAERHFKWSVRVLRQWWHLSKLVFIGWPVFSIKKKRIFGVVKGENCKGIRMIFVVFVFSDIPHDDISGLKFYDSKSDQMCWVQ